MGTIFSLLFLAGTSMAGNFGDQSGNASNTEEQKVCFNEAIIQGRPVVKCIPKNADGSLRPAEAYYPDGKPNY